MDLQNKQTETEKAFLELKSKGMISRQIIAEELKKIRELTKS